MTKNESQGEARFYEIRIEGHLSSPRACQFEGMCVELEPNGETVVCGRIVDQAALFGLLTRIRDLNMPLISVTRLGNRSSSLSRKEK